MTEPTTVNTAHDLQTAPANKPHVETTNNNPQANNGASKKTCHTKSITQTTSTISKPHQKNSTTTSPVRQQTATNVSTPEIATTSDFNAWSPLWGSASYNQRGYSIENAILTSNCFVLNDGSPTHFSTHSTFTHIDLTLSSPSLSNNSSWHLIDDLQGSDHFPILIKILTSRPTIPFSPRIKFKTDRADWNKFESACDFYSKSFPTSSNINQDTSNIHKAIRCASNVSIPLSSTKPVKPAPLWWNNEIASLRQAKQQAWHNFNRNRFTTTLIQFKELNAQFRRKINDAKLDCFQKFTSSISASSDPEKIWADIKTLTGLPSNRQIYSLNTSHGNRLYPQDIAQEFASHFPNASSDQTFPSEFIASKRSEILQHRITPTTLSHSAKLVEADISLYELQRALSAVKG
ncbi:uncharacterized protein LOC125776485 [Bactrocera dorsalis]|uniref:Uncharacterized protein LOC125776485 n=1 Tax=Bactrocera dorsalis TaxID=27457 RepID=A0ABM3J5S5_BACDO|nr:uncharacterized protein LOC125776485 [Bactrocera dorsalis]